MCACKDMAIFLNLICISKNLVFQTLLMILPTLITKFGWNLKQFAEFRKKIKQKVLLDPVVIVLLFILQTAKPAQREAPLETVS